MIFEKIKIKNFLSYEEEEVKIQKGLHLISGWNSDLQTSNGSGKSAITDAICWTITGELPRKVSADSVINWVNGKGCKNELFLREGDNKYKIVRGRSPNVLEFFINDVKTVGENVNKTQEIIERILGINYNLFINSVYFAQNSQIQFVTANDNTKKELLTELLSLNIFDEMCEKVKEKIKKLEQERYLLDKNLINYTENLELKKKNLEEYENLVCNFENNRKNRIEEIRNRIVEERKSQIEKESSIRESLDNNLSLLVRYKEERERKAIELSCQEGSMEQIRSEALLKMREKNSLNESLHNCDNTFNSEIYKYKSIVRDLEGKASYRKIEADKIMSEILKIENTAEGSCNICYQPISRDVLESKKNQLARDAYEIAIDINNINKEIEENNNIKINLEKKRVEELDKYKISERDLESKLLDLGREEATKMGLIKNIKTELNNLDSELRNRDVVIGKLKEELSLLGAIFREKENGNNESIKNIEVEVNPYKEVINLTKKEIESNESSIIKISSEVKSIEEDLFYEDFLKESFGNRGIKAYVFEQVVNEINRKADENLSYLFDDNIKIEFRIKDTKNTKGEISHKFETHLRLDGRDVEFGSLSGGEKRRIILAVDLAVSQIIQNRSNKSINLLVFDEYFEGLDNIGKEKTMELLKRIENVSILVIDHNTVFSSLFDSIISVEKRDKISRIIK